MKGTLSLVHTVSPLLDVFNRLGAELLPGVRLLHVLDEPLLEVVRVRGRLDAQDADRLLEHVRMAERAGAAAVLVTCSTVSPSVDGVREQAPIPVLKIDEAMVERAVAQGRRIGVVATNHTTLEPTRLSLTVEAARAGRQVEVELVLAEGALEALFCGDGALHDALVVRAVGELAQRVDVVVLAQASMARALATIPEAERAVPVLSSPHLALERVREMLVARE